MDLTATSRFVGVEAQLGAGASTLLAEIEAAHDGATAHVALTGTTAGPAQLRSKLHRSLQEHGLSDLVAALELSGQQADLPLTLLVAHTDATPLLLLIDDLHLADDALIELLAGMVRDWPAPHRLVLAGRRLPSPLAEVIEHAGGCLLGTAELRFRAKEARHLLGTDVADRMDETDVALLTERCDGWAAALVLAATQLRRAAATSDAAFKDEVSRLVSRPATLADLLDSLLARVPADTRRAIHRVGHIPELDDAIARTAGLTDGLATLTDLGLPLTPSFAGHWSMPDAIRSLLTPGDPDAELVRFAAERYADAGHLGSALEILRGPGLEEELADLLLSFPPSDFGRLDASSHAAAVGALPHRLLASHPRILVHLADSYLVAGRLEDYRATIARARAFVDEGDGELTPEALEVTAADLTMRAAASDGSTSITEMEQLLTRSDLPPTARARLLGGVGRALANRRTPSELRAGARRLDEAADLFQQQGATVHARTTRVVAATFAAWPLGRYDEALEQLGRVLTTTRSSIRVAVLPYRAFILVDLGRYAEAEADLAEVRHAARTIGTISNERSAAFARWAAAKMASQQGDAEATWAACHAVESSDIVVDAGHGAFFRADAAQLLARVGHIDEAERLLAEAKLRDPGTTGLVALAEFAVATYAGELDRAEAAFHALGGQIVEPRMQWRVTLLRAHARNLAGAGDARMLAAAAFEQAAQLGHPELPLIGEPDIGRALLPLAAESSASAREAEATSTIAIRVLGGFDVTIEGQRTEPSGRPGELIAFLAVHGGSATVEQTVEALWPEGDPARGRQRLRTVLRRVREQFPGLVAREDDQLRFQTGVHLDADAFVTFAQQARALGSDHPTAASAALSLYRGEALPKLVYPEWAMDARQQFHRQALAMHDLLATAADNDGRLDDAIRQHQAALEMDDTDVGRYLVAARLLAEQGRRSSALRLLGDARAAMDRHGLEPPQEVASLEGYLRRGPSAVSSSA